MRLCGLQCKGCRKTGFGCLVGGICLFCITDDIDFTADLLRSFLQRIVRLHAHGEHDRVKATDGDFLAGLLIDNAVLIEFFTVALTIF